MTRAYKTVKAKADKGGGQNDEQKGLVAEEHGAVHGQLGTLAMSPVLYTELPRRTNTLLFVHILRVD